MDLDNRELSVLIWLVLVIGWSAAKSKDLRGSLVGVWRALIAWRLLIAWVLMAIYICGSVLLLHRLGVWDQPHLKITLLWSATVAMVSFVQVAPADLTAFKNVALQNFKLTVLLDFLVNLYVFPLVVELVLVPFIALIAGVSAIAQVRHYKEVERFTNNVFVGVGFIFIVYFAYSVYSDFGTFARIETAKNFLVPLALSILFIPFIYAGLLYATYERLFRLLHFYVKDMALSRYAKRTMVARCHVNVEKLERVRKRLLSSDLRWRQDIDDFFAFTAEQTADAPAGFRSLKWGDPPSPDMRRFTGPTGESPNLYVPASSTSLAPFLGVPVSEEMYSFSENRFCSGTVWIDGLANHEAIRRNVARAYGPPSFSNEDRAFWKWEWQSSNVEIQIWFQPKSARTTVMFSNKAN